MKLRLFCMLMVVAFLGLSAQGALAASGHGHHHHDHHADKKGFSPFHGKAHGHTLHCILLGHALNKPCPKASRGHKVPAELSRPCHTGSLPGPVAGGSGQLEFAGAIFPWNPSPPLTAFNELFPSSYKFRFISPLDRPPQSV